MTKTFHDLTIWQKAHSLTLQIYQVTKSFPACERYSLTTHTQEEASLNH